MWLFFDQKGYIKKSKAKKTIWKEQFSWHTVTYGKIYDDHKKKQSQSRGTTAEMLWSDRWTEQLLEAGIKSHTIWKRAPIIDEIFSKDSSCKVSSTCWEKVLPSDVLSLKLTEKLFKDLDIPS